MKLADRASALACALSGAGRDFARQWRQRGRGSAASVSRRDLAVAACCLVAIALASLLFDRAFVLAARGLDVRWYLVFDHLTAFGKSGQMFLWSAVICLAAAVASQLAARRRDRAAMGLLAGMAAYLFAVLAVSGVMTQVIKQFGRGRPRLMDDGGVWQFKPFAFEAVWWSFPSGHTTTAFAFATAVGLLFRGWLAPLLVAAALVGASRVVLGSHFPSDIVAGACIGAGAAILLRRAFARRRIVFAVREREIVRRGRGVLWPALRRAFRLARPGPAQARQAEIQKDWRSS